MEPLMATEYMGTFAHPLLPRGRMPHAVAVRARCGQGAMRRIATEGVP